MGTGDGYYVSVLSIQKFSFLPLNMGRWESLEMV